MYGVESCVDPAYQGQGIGGMLTAARFDVLRRLNLRGMIAGGMIMDYHQVADQISPEDYVREVVAGVRFDNNLTKQLRMGFKPKNLIPNYDEDPRAMNYGVALLWENPDYDPKKGIVRSVQPRQHAVKLKPRKPAQAALHASKRPGLDNSRRAIP